MAPSDELGAWSAATSLAGRSPQHLGYVVADLDATLATISELGVVVSEVLTLDLGPDDLDMGEPTSLRLGFAMLGGLMAEFIEPEAGPNVWSRALEERGPGMHHVAFTEVEGFDDVVTALTGTGFAVSVAGHFGDDRWCYLERGPLVIEMTSGEGPARRFEGG